MSFALRWRAVDLDIGSKRCASPSSRGTSSHPRRTGPCEQSDGFDELIPGLPLDRARLEAEDLRTSTLLADPLNPPRTSGFTAPTALRTADL